jgi:hypothetical protein
MKQMITVALLATISSISFALTDSEPNSTTGNAQCCISFPDTITGAMSTDDGALGPEDMYQFSAIAGRTYTFVATPTNTSSFFPIDLGLAIYNGGTNPVQLQDANGDNAGETLTYNAAASGTLQFSVYEATGIANNVAGYSVSASQSVAGLRAWNLY